MQLEIKDVTDSRFNRGNRYLPIFMPPLQQSTTVFERSIFMDQKEIFRQMVDFNKGAFNNAFNAMVLVQDQTETLATTMLNQATWMPEEGKKAVREWVDVFKKGRETYKKTVEEAFKKVEAFF
jgi:hypothetical protein